MWLVTFCFELILFVQIGSFGSESPPLPQPSKAEPSIASLSKAYPERPPRPLPGTDLLTTTRTTSKPRSQTEVMIALKPTGVSPPSSPHYHSSSCARITPPNHSTNTIIPSTDAVLSPSVHLLSTSIPAIPTNVPIVSTTSMATCEHEHSYSCKVEYPIGCSCDELCNRFGDCCFDSNQTHSASIPEFECVSSVVLKEKENSMAGVGYYWMIASCPNKESDSETLNRIADLCKALSLTIPPVSDNRTGLVFRNMYCAQCHGVPEKVQVPWPSEWNCDFPAWFAITSMANNSTVDIQYFLAHCNSTVFIVPEGIADKDGHFPLRACDRRIIYKCQPPPESDTSSKEYRALERLCRSEPGRARTIGTDPGIYKNEYCALCSSSTMNRSNLGCPPQVNKRFNSEPPHYPFTLLLDVTGTGLRVSGQKNIQITSITEQSCAQGKVFDVYRNKCRKSPCPLGFSYSGSDCLPVPSNCTLITLNDTEYQRITNQILYWTILEQNVSVQGYDTEGNPLVCTNFTSNFTIEVNKTITRTLYGYPEAFAILSYLGMSVDVVAATILLFTYAAFSQMQTFYGKLFMNFVLVLLLGDLTFLLGTAAYAVSLKDVVCQVVAILLHYLFLARFVWMSLLSLNVARHFYHAAKFIVSEERESWRNLILYMAAGWLSPLLVLLVTVPLNYAIPGTVGYGLNRRCWMNQTLAIIVTFIVPLAICILFTTGAFIFVCIVLVKMRGSDVTKDPKPKTASRNCRVLAAVFCVTGAMWLFGFLALIDSALSWAWYIFIILNTTQAVFLTLAYMCTAKVLHLYRNALINRAALLTRFQCYIKRDHSKLHSNQQTTQLELTQASMATSTTHS